MKKIFFVFLLVLFNNSYSQVLDFLPRGLGIELGLGYNQIKFQEIPTAPFFNSESLLRDAFKLTPTFRISWEKDIIRNFSIKPFISYSITGGKSNKSANGYEDEYIFKTLDLGLFASYKFYNTSFSIGGKYNRFLDVTGRFYGSSVDLANTNREWNEEDMSSLFKKWSIDLGGRVSYSYYHFTIALEGWYSVSELINKDYENFTNVSSKRFQLLVGYQL